jgi:chromosomal replication initiation ATPase DnaA
MKFHKIIPLIVIQNELTQLDPRLVSRFLGACRLELEPPDIETRIEILLKKQKAMMWNYQ